MPRTGLIICKALTTPVTIFGTLLISHSYQCLFCDGIERAHLPIGLLRAPPGTLLHVAMMASHLTGDPSKATIFTDCVEEKDPKTLEVLSAVASHGCLQESRKIARICRAQSPEVGVDVIFADGERRSFGFLLDKPRTKPVGQEMIVDGLGVELVENMFGTDLRRNEFSGESNVKGVFVAGDAGTRMKAVMFACASGSLAGGAISSQLCTEEGEEALASAKDVSSRDIAVEVRDSTSCSA